MVNIIDSIGTAAHEFDGFVKIEYSHKNERPSVTEIIESQPSYEEMLKRKLTKGVWENKKSLSYGVCTKIVFILFITYVFVSRTAFIQSQIIIFTQKEKLILNLNLKTKKKNIDIIKGRHTGTHIVQIYRFRQTHQSN